MIFNNLILSIIAGTCASISLFMDFCNYFKGFIVWGAWFDACLCYLEM